MSGSTFRNLKLNWIPTTQVEVSINDGSKTEVVRIIKLILSYATVTINFRVRLRLHFFSKCSYGRRRL